MCHRHADTDRESQLYSPLELKNVCLSRPAQRLGSSSQSEPEVVFLVVVVVVVVFCCCCCCRFRFVNDWTRLELSTRSECAVGTAEQISQAQGTTLQNPVSTKHQHFDTANIRDVCGGVWGDRCIQHFQRGRGRLESRRYQLPSMLLA